MPRRGIPFGISLKREYEVEKIIRSKFDRFLNTYVYHVKWMGYPESFNTWEPAWNLGNAKFILDSFLQKQNLSRQKRELKQLKEEHEENGGDHSEDENYTPSKVKKTISKRKPLPLLKNSIATMNQDTSNPSSPQVYNKSQRQQRSRNKISSSTLTDQHKEANQSQQITIKSEHIDEQRVELIIPNILFNKIDEESPQVDPINILHNQPIDSNTSQKQLDNEKENCQIETTCSSLPSQEQQSEKCSQIKQKLKTDLETIQNIGANQEQVQPNIFSDQSRLEQNQCNEEEPIKIKTEEIENQLKHDLVKNKRSQRIRELSHPKTDYQIETEKYEQLPKKKQSSRLQKQPPEGRSNASSNNYSKPLKKLKESNLIRQKTQITAQQQYQNGDNLQESNKPKYTIRKLEKDGKGSWQFCVQEQITGGLKSYTKTIDETLKIVHPKLVVNFLLKFIN